MFSVLFCGRVGQLVEIVQGCHNARPLSRKTWMMPEIVMDNKWYETGGATRIPLLEELKIFVPKILFF